MDSRIFCRSVIEEAFVSFWYLSNLTKMTSSHTRGEVRLFAPFSSQWKLRACHCCHCHIGTPIRQCSCFLLGSVRFILGAWQQLWDFLVSRGRGSWKSWAQIGGLSNWAIQGFGRRVQDNGENWQCVSMEFSGEMNADQTQMCLKGRYYYWIFGFSIFLYGEWFSSPCFSLT